jgi:ArsR family metal-binding transcriptional regulator
MRVGTRALAKKDHFAMTIDPRNNLSTVSRVDVVLCVPQSHCGLIHQGKACIANALKTQDASKTRVLSASSASPVHVPRMKMRESLGHATEKRSSSHFKNQPIQAVQMLGSAARLCKKTAGCDAA